ncbi:Serine phosphatase RsbU, regulator of sigma subunit [Blastococcus aurantiacus]|uniref:Serine phosphatase RsbU, regulator of sigma subunit n=1 Tax=Blastococcus aurantiacus TaxID=1550231 RepID=A0A1G7QCN7_9ACTN|nr:SpoIIE family protein phosphatase [Blastococcus aurantiacus]SDF96321.1 Serine phosphatase RsbU, regulator of sigma subunit [Blastococcus aurantiacus]
MTPVDPTPGAGERVAAVARLEATAVGSPALQRLTALAVQLLGADAAQVSLFGIDELVLGGTGLPQGTVGIRVPLAESLCAVTTTAAPDPVVAADARLDPRLAGLPPVAGGTVASYLGLPLAVFDGQVVGALSAFGRRPRDWSDADVALLRQLGDAVAVELQLAAQVRELESSRLAFELAIDAAGIGSFDWDLAGGRLVWDDRLQELMGFEPDAFDQTIEAFAARCHPDDRERTMEALQAAIDTVGEYDAEFRVVLPSGETRWIQGRGRALADETGVAVRLVGAGYDTTAQRHADARVARVMESVKSAFFSLDRDWRFTYLNAEAERVLQSSRDDLLGQVVWDAFPEAAEAEFGVRYLEAVGTGREQVFEAYYPAPLDAWFEVRAWPGPDGLSVSFLDVTERRAAEDRARRSAARLRLIADTTAAMAQRLATGAGEEAALQNVAEALVPVSGDWVIASLVDEDGRVRDVAVRHRDAASTPLVERYAALRLAALPPGAPVLAALATGQPREIPDVMAAVGRSMPSGEAAEVLQELAPRSAVTLPLTARGRTLGALSVYRSADRQQADAEDVATLRDIGDRVALALDNSRLYEQQRRLAEGLQRSMLTEPPEPDHAEIVVRYLPAVQVAEVGGDWYDAFLQPSGATVLVIGDVVGHDTAAAAAMGQLRGMLRGIGYRDGIGPAAVLADLDAAIDGLGMGTMATAAIARVEQTPEERAQGLSRLRWSNAGHPPPLLLHPDGRIEELATERAELMLGVDPSARRTETVVTVRRGATLLLYTDGLVEGRDLPLDEGIDRLRKAFAELADRPLAELCDEVITRLRPEGLQDDVALVAIRLHREDRPRPREAGPEQLPSRFA